MADGILGQIANPPGTNMPERLSSLATARQQRKTQQAATEAQNLQNARTQLQEVGRSAKALMDTYYPEGQEQPTNPAQAAKDYFKVRDRLVNQMGVPEESVPNRIPRRSELQQAFEQAQTIEQQMASEPQPQAQQFRMGNKIMQRNPDGTMEEVTEFERPSTDVKAQDTFRNRDTGQTETLVRTNQGLARQTVDQQGRPQFEFVDSSRYEEVRTPSTEVNVGGEQSAFDKARTGALEDEFKRLGTTREAARGTRRLTSGLSELVVRGDVQTGAVQPAVTGLQNLAESVGVDLQSFASGMGINLGNLSKKEEFDRLSQRLTINQFEKFKGNLNSREVQIAQDSVAQLGTSKEGNIEALASLQASSRLAERRANRLLGAETEEEYRRIQREIEQQGTEEYKALRNEIRDRLKAGMDEEEAIEGAQTQPAPEQEQPEGQRMQFTETTPAEPTTEEEFNQLPQGSVYRHPEDGRLYRKQ